MQPFHAGAVVTYTVAILRCRLVVGQQVLILLTVVRIHAPQPELSV